MSARTKTKLYEMIDNFFGNFSMIDIQNVNIVKICGQNKDWYPIFYIYF